MAAVAAELEAERLKSAQLQEELDQMRAKLNAAKSCKAYTQKGRRGL
jgi:hypothetical protein